MDAPLTTCLDKPAATNAVSARCQRLYAEHGERIYRYCYRLTGRASDAEDLTQEVFVAAYQGWDRFEQRSSVLTWLYKIALYRWRRALTQVRAAQSSIAEDAKDVSGDPERLSVQRILLDNALAQLPDDLLDAFVLVKAEGLKYREAAIALDIPQGTVQWRVSEAVHRLRALLSDPVAEGMPGDEL
ncbi:MAG: RNA polymerase sigma factor [Capsulimonadaceae bacterium]|nr:RNA polymerase sigma factor [Capsulimonadaceae bacterium]